MSKKSKNTRKNKQKKKANRTAKRVRWLNKRKAKLKKKGKKLEYTPVLDLSDLIFELMDEEGATPQSVCEALTKMAEDADDLSAAVEEIDDLSEDLEFDDPMLADLAELKKLLEKEVASSCKECSHDHSHDKE